MKREIQPVKNIGGTIRVPGDKSIAHRVPHELECDYAETRPNRSGVIEQTSTLISVPTCRATSKLRELNSSSSQPKSLGIKTRWAVELIGRNSVIPCTMPNIIASNIFVYYINYSWTTVHPAQSMTEKNTLSRNIQAGFPLLIQVRIIDHDA